MASFFRSWVGECAGAHRLAESGCENQCLGSSGEDRVVRVVGPEEASVTPLDS